MTAAANDYHSVCCWWQSSSA